MVKTLQKIYHALVIFSDIDGWLVFSGLNSGTFWVFSYDHYIMHPIECPSWIGCFNKMLQHSEHLGRFRGKLASDVLELLTTKWHPPYLVLDVISALLLTFALWHIFRQNSFVLKALYTSDEQEFLGYILYIISINLYYRSKYFLA